MPENTEEICENISQGSHSPSRNLNQGLSNTTTSRGAVKDRKSIEVNHYSSTRSCTAENWGRNFHLLSRQAEVISKRQYQGDETRSEMRTRLMGKRCCNWSVCCLK
jgi:IS5 family transposase